MNIHSIFRMFRRHKHRSARKSCPYSDYQTLNQVQENEKVRIICNPDRKTLEMGIYPNSVVSMMRNHESEQNLIIAVDNGRIIVARNIAEKIRIKPIL